MVYNYAGNVDLSKGCWNPKERLGETVHFLEIIDPKLEKNVIHCYILESFLEFNGWLWSPTIFFWDSYSPC